MTSREDNTIDRPEYATASDIAEWSRKNARRSQEQLPELVRQLLLETPGAEEVSVRTGDGIVLSGKDGSVNLQEPTNLLPAGRIWFEFGTNERIRPKANSDYEKALKDAEKDTTFVFITSRRWPRKDAWVGEARKTPGFRDVKALDADDLHTWLEIAPVAHLWLSEKMGFRPRDVETLSSWWEKFSRSTDPELPRDLFVAGRTSEVQSLSAKLGSDEPAHISIGVDWVKDGWGFVHAALAGGETETIVRPQAVVVSSAAAWENICSRPGSGILIPGFDEADVAEAVRSGRHIVSVIDSESATPNHVSISLPEVGVADAVSAFLNSDTRWPRAHKLGVAAHRSIYNLVCRISPAISRRKPAWSKGPTRNILAALVLAGGWEDRPDDKELLCHLADVTPNELNVAIDEGAQGADAAIRKGFSKAGFVDTEAAFRELHPSIDESLIARWKKDAISVLLEPDPLDGLSLAKHVQASAAQTRRKYSPGLRNGVANSLAFAGSLPSTPGVVNRVRAAANEAVKRVLRAITSHKPGCHWRLIAEQLPLLAEASPEAFLECLENDLEEQEPTVGELFVRSDRDLFSGHSMHAASLLWALDVLCWSKQYLVRAIRILTKLQRYFEHDDNLPNPLERMSIVLCTRLNQTEADIPTRQNALDACHKENPAVGSELLKRILFPDSSIEMLNGPVYRPWESESLEILEDDYQTLVSGLVDRALAWADGDPSELPGLVDLLVSLDDRRFDRRLFDRTKEFLMRKAAGDDLDKEIRLAMYEKARAAAAKHTKYQGADWALPSSQCASLVELAEALAPRDDLRRFTHLFSERQELFGFDRTNPDAPGASLESMRIKALKTARDCPDPWGQLASLVSQVDRPDEVGRLLARVQLPGTSEAISAWFSSGSKNLTTAAGTWAHYHLFDEGPDALRTLLETGDRSSAKVHGFVVNLPAEKRFWDVLDEFPESRKFYWSTMQRRPHHDEDLTEAIEMLLQHGRPWMAVFVAAIGIAGAQQKSTAELPGAELIQATLNCAIRDSSRPKTLDPTTEIGVGRLFDHLSAKGAPSETMAFLELEYTAYLPARYERKALRLRLAADPELFARLVRASRGLDPGPSAQTGLPSSQRSVARRVLDEWDGCPGMQADGEIDEDRMYAWIQAVREDLRSDPGEDVNSMIGRTFAKVPPGPNDVWPPIAVCRLIDNTEGRDTRELLGSGLMIGVQNTRGASVRAADSGGAGERESAAQYRGWADFLEVDFPRTAAVLRRIAAEDKAEAIRQDESARGYLDSI